MIFGPRFVSDTHSLLWFVCADSRIGPRAKAEFLACERGQSEIIIPAIVLVEAISIISNPKKEIPLAAGQLLSWLESDPHFVIASLDLPTIQIYERQRSHLASLRDDHDRLIIATSQRYGGIPIITKDAYMSPFAEVIW